MVGGVFKKEKKKPTKHKTFNICYIVFPTKKLYSANNSETWENVAQDHSM